VVCDEPISALDVSVQAQVVNLLADLKESMGLTLLFIAHDLSMVRYISDRMAVMYLGGLVEVGDADEVFFKPMHPYTKTLIASNPEADPRSERQRVSTTIQGEIPSPVNIPAGCRFANRCPQAMPVCHQITPVLKTPTVAKTEEHFDENRQVACHLYD
jgi:oligopeptide/dipeptide ABC transporter ATP-binding protein